MTMERAGQVGKWWDGDRGGDRFAAIGPDRSVTEPTVIETGKVGPRRGTVVHREKVEKIPSGFGE